MPELVAVDGGPVPAFVDALRAAWDAGDAVLPVDPRLPAAARRRLLAELRPTVLGGRAVAGRPVAEGDALVVATSGTTGEPKGVVLTREAVAASAVATSARLGVDPDRHTWVNCLPVAHAGGLGVVTRAVLTSTPLRMVPPVALDATAAAVRAEGRVPLTSVVATLLARIDTDAFGTILLGGDRPPARPPANAVITYGMTETGGGCVYDGRPLDGVEVAVRAGAVWVRTAMLGRAYRRAEVDVPIADADGWFATGDGGAIEADGSVRVDGRIGDMIVTGGEKVWPAPVEEIVAGLDGVGAVAIIGRPDPEWGQRVVALVVADGDRPPTLADVQRAVRAVLPVWAAPKELELVTDLPRTPTGKLSRAAASRRRPRTPGR